jgi:hypothetical protein
VILEHLSAEALLAELSSPIPPERSGAVLVTLSEGTPPASAVARRPASLPVVVVGVRQGNPADGWLELCDVVVDEGDPALEAITTNLESFPIATASLALLLRGQSGRSVDEGLVAESATYSLLQSGPEFAAWRSSWPARHSSADDTGPRVRTERDGGCLAVTLTRPDRLNALDARMRDELVEALTVPAADPSVTRVELRGEGRAFCAGGDLDEFGSRADPASAHLVRLERSVGRTIAGLRPPTTAYVHGPTIGSGIEIAAFCGRVVAAPDTQIALPEIGLGLVPGAGGTVSLVRRVGRLRTAWLAFSGATIDAATAVAWSLVDGITT